MRQILLAYMCLWVGLGVFAQQPPSAAANSSSVPPSGQVSKSDSDLIGAGDLLEMAVGDVPELTSQVRVTDQGTVALPILGIVKLGGLTVQQAQDEIARLLLEKDVVRKPVVSILISEYANQVVSVLGEVGKPSTFPLIGQRRLYDALSAAGGLLPTASNQVTLLRRGEPEREIAISINANSGALEAGNIELRAGDTVVVRRAGVVYVVGDVGKPGGFVMRGDRMSVLQALALAEGAKNTAKLNHAMIVHRDGAAVEQRPVKLQLILEAKAPDVTLGPDDVLFIPRSLAKASAGGVAEAVLRMASAALIYVAQ